MPCASRFRSERAAHTLAASCYIAFAYLCPFFDVLFQDNNEASLATQLIAADNHDEIIQVA